MADLPVKSKAGWNPLSFRVFRLYLAGSAYEFRCGRLGIYQTLLAKPARGQSGLPLTRADWYR
jgi:cyclopropane-fatty-acyl-phospholipid synthase